MRPAQPPLSTPANLPFHVSMGSQTSNAMCESAVGRSSPTTRQNAGRVVTESVDPGTLNVPRVTRSTEVRTVFSSLTEVSCSHGVGAIRFERDDPKPTKASNAAATRGVFILFLEL